MLIRLLMLLVHKRKATKVMVHKVMGHCYKNVS